MLLQAGIQIKAQDVVIYGGTPSGIAAAVTAAREGANVTMIESTRWIGGMVAGGLVHSDIGNKDTIGGFPLEFFTLAAKDLDPKFMWYADSRTNMQTFEKLLKDAGVKVITGQRLKSIVKEGTRIISITTLDGQTYKASQFVDASYEGDLMAQAGVSYIVGRESHSTYGEELAGFHPMPLRPRSEDVMARGGKPSYIHGTPAKISALDDKGNLIFGVYRADPSLKPGDGDGLTQAYNFRVVVTQNPENRIPFPKPTTYQPERYELLLRLIKAFPKVSFARLFHLGEVANGKYDLNAQGLFSTDYPGGNTGYPDGDYATRDRIWQDHVDFIQGMLWFLCHDEKVPAELREEASSWGLCKDEFADNNHWPYALYVREGRRMKGEYVMQQKDCQSDITKPDSVGMGSFVIDCHIVQRIVTKDGSVTDEGSFQDSPARPYHIPYRSLTPKKDECSNLLVTVCFSASHIAYCSMRMEPVYMSMGHAAGLALIQAEKTGKAVQEIDVTALQKKLLGQKAVLSLNLPEILLVKNLPGIVQDDNKAEYVGHWTKSGFGNPIEGSSQHDENDDKGNKSATFTLPIEKDGAYEVRVACTRSGNRASNVPITIKHTNGSDTHSMNQRVMPPKGKDQYFDSFGVYQFKAGEPAIITISNKDTDGIVSIDAVQLLPQ